LIEVEWLAPKHPCDLYQSLRRWGSRRKLRLHACACCRKVWPFLTDERSRRAVEVSERYADGLASKQEVSAAQGLAWLAIKEPFEEYKTLSSAVSSLRGIPRTAEDSDQRSALHSSAQDAGGRYDAARAAKAASRSTDKPSRVAEELTLAAYYAFSAGLRRDRHSGGPPYSAEGAQAYFAYRSHAFSTYLAEWRSLVHCIFGNPFRPTPSLFGEPPPGLVEVAGRIYEDRSFDRMPELADLLEREGCDDSEVLAHARSDADHVRGCWVLDTILGRS
jgi:hypothetical protein